MSEEKIIKHTHQAVHIIEDRSKPWRHKIKQLLEEIIIIIVAVSITLAFHNWNDWRSERKIEKEFLAGTSDDLKKSAQLVDAGVRDLTEAAKYYDNVWKQIKTNKINAGYIDSNSYQLTNTSYFVFDNGRFEGFKSSGYLRLIENQVLLKHITTLFTLEIPFQQHADDLVYDDRRRTYYETIGTKAPMDTNKVVHVSKIINDPSVKYQVVFYGNSIHERIMQKKELAADMRTVAGEIDEELKNR
jgi:hypothetical protein